MVEPTAVSNWGELFFSWLDQYGAMSYLAIYGMAWTIVAPLCTIVALFRVAGPISEIARILRKLEARKDD